MYCLLCVNSLLLRNIYLDWFQLTLLISTLTATMPLNLFVVLCDIQETTVCRCLVSLGNNLLSAMLPNIKIWRCFSFNSHNLTHSLHSHNHMHCFGLSWKRNSVIYLGFKGIWGCSLFPRKRPYHVSEPHVIYSEKLSQVSTLETAVSCFFFVCVLILPPS